MIPRSNLTREMTTNLSKNLASGQVRVTPPRTREQIREVTSSHLFFDIDRLRPQSVNLIAARPQPTTIAATFYDESVVITVKILRRQSRSVLRRQFGREHLRWTR